MLAFTRLKITIIISGKAEIRPDILKRHGKLR